MSATPDADDYLIADEGSSPSAPPDRASKPGASWKVLVVDDDEEIHAVTRLALRDFVALGRPVELFHETSAAGAERLLREHRDAAVLLLDVVMESDDAGLRLVPRIRRTLGLDHLRIILRTGQPGYAPEERVMTEYDINDYRSKIELTARQLRTAVTAGIRSYRDLQTIAAQREGLQRVVEANGAFFRRVPIDPFVRGLAQKAAEILFPRENAVLFVSTSELFGASEGSPRVVASTGRFSVLDSGRLRDVVPGKAATDVEGCLASGTSLVADDHAVFGFHREGVVSAALYVETGAPLEPWEAQFLELFATNAALALSNHRLLDDRERALDEARASLTRMEAAHRELRVEFEARHAAETKILHQRDKLHEVQKLEALGRLASSVSHDFNNLLSAVFSYVDVIREGLARGTDVRVDLDELESTARSGASLTKQLLALNRPQAETLQPVDVVGALDDAKRMLGRLLPPRIALELQAPPAGEPLRILVDPSHFLQVLTNLALNAADAMPQGGTLSLGGRIVTQDGRQQVVVSVNDTGTGMSPATRARIFEPFFTTKEGSQGTGLGLSTVETLVAAAGGSVRVHSVVGQGTRFDLVFPAFDPSVMIWQQRPPHRVSTPAPRKPTFLVADAHVHVAVAAARALEALGAHVIVATTGREALDLAERAPHLDALFADVNLTDLSGVDLATRLRARWPRLLARFWATDDESAPPISVVVADGHALLRKPIDADQITNAAGEMLADLARISPRVE